MPRILNILTQPGDQWPEGLEKPPAEGMDEKSTMHSTTIFDLTTSSPDYDALLAAIFKADAVHVW